jgi:hypothetical protein
MSLLLPLVPVHSKYIVGTKTLVPLFVLSLNHQNPHLGLIALTISPFLVIDAKTNKVKKMKILCSKVLLNNCM